MPLKEAFSITMDRRSMHLLTVLCYATLAQAFSSFDTNCTIPDRTYDYVQGPNTRGSLQIVWSCMATLTACTYTVLHLNIPEQRAGRDGGYSRYLKTWWQRGNPSIVRMTIAMSAVAYPWSENTSPHLTRTLGMLVPRDTTASERLWSSWRTALTWWYKINIDTAIYFVLTLIAPEWYSYVAIGQRHSASEYKAEFEMLPPHLHPPCGWTLTHIHFANMGGFVVRSSSGSSTLRIIHLTAKSLLQIIQEDHEYIAFESLPSREELQDRSKSDALTKGLVILQIMWFVANCITRLVKGLPTIQLEMSILGTAVCSLVSYLALFEKPHNIKTTTAVLAYTGDIPRYITDILQTDDDVRTHDGTIVNDDTPDGPHQRPNYDVWEYTADLVLSLLAAILGAFHVAAWNFAFPTDADRVIWRVVSIIMCAIALVFIPLAYAANFLEGRYGNGWVLRVATLAVFLYAILRMILAGLMIRFLFYIPPGAFLASWADTLPHI